MRIECWQIVQFGPADYRVQGIVGDGPHAGGGIWTSPIERFEEQTKTVTTRSGSRYELGAPLNPGRIVLRPCGGWPCDGF